MDRRLSNFQGGEMTEKQHNPDRLSMLPEALIIRILSMLEMKDAVKTGILSKMWEHLWTQVDSLVFKCQLDYLYWKHVPILQRRESMEAQTHRMISFVDHTLMQCTANIERFCLSGNCDFSAVIDKWIAYVLENRVKILELDFHCDRVPECLYQSSSITTLKLGAVKVCMSSPVNWSSLKNLELVLTEGVSIEKILMGCPVLETMVLDGVDGINHLNVMSPSVKRLELYNIPWDNEVLKIRAPWLEELKISKRFIANQCQLVDISSLAKATLTFTTVLPMKGDFALDWNEWVTQRNYVWIPMVTRLLKSVSHVGELIIGSEPIQVLSLSKLLGRPSPLFKCKKLSIETHIWKYDLPGIAYLLENAPHLETLFIKVVVSDWQDMFPLPQTEELFQHGDPHLSMPNGKFLNLKNVKIDYWRSSCRDDTEHIHGAFFDFELVEYILKSAVVLEKLVLCSSIGSCVYRCPMPSCSFQYVPRLSSKLLTTFLVGNEAAEWELRKCKYKFEFTFPNYASLLLKD